MLSKIKELFQKNRLLFSCPVAVSRLEDCDEKIARSFRRSPEAETAAKRNSFLKNRLILFSLFFIIFAVSLPLRAVKAIYIPVLSEAWGAVTAVGGCVADPLGCMLTMVYVVVYQIAHIVLMIASYLVKLGAWLVDAMLEPQIYSQVLDIDNPSSAVMTGWTVIRDMGNIFFVLLLLIIAFSTILRIQQYNARTLLPKFIIVLFLMNFSAVFAGIVIDFGQVFMYEIRNWMGQFSTDAGSMGSLTSFVDSDFIRNFGFSPRGGGGYSLENAVGVSFAAIFVLLMGACYIMLAGFLLIRLIAFAILIILSPAAVLGLVMPGLRSISSEWWQKIWQYSLFGPLFIFFVYLAGTMATSLKGYAPAVTPTGFGEAGNPLSYLVALIVPYCVSLGMLYAVIPITQRLGIAGASMLIGGTMGFGKVLMGSYMAAKIPFIAGKRLAKEADKRTGGRASNWLGKQKEKVLKNLPGGIGKGQVLKDKAKAEKDKEDNMKIIRIEFGEAKNRDLDLLHEKARGKLATKEDRALFAETAAAQGKLGDAKYAGDIKNWMPEIERTLSGKDLEQITNKDLSLYAETGEATKKIEEAGAGNYSSFSDETAEKLKAGKITAEEAVKEDKMMDIVREGKAHEVQGLNNKMDAKVWHESQTSEQRKSSMSRMAKDQRNELAKGYMQNAYQTDAEYSAASKEDQRRDMEYRTSAVKLGKGLEESFTRGGNIAAKEIEEAFGKFGSKEIADLDIKDVKKYGYKANSSQIRSLNRIGEYEVIDAIRSSKEDRLSSGVKMGAIGGIKSMVNYNKAKSDLETAKGNLDREIKIGGDPARIDRLRKTVQGLEAKLKPFSEIEKDIETIDNSLTGKSY